MLLASIESKIDKSDDSKYLTQLIDSNIFFNRPSLLFYLIFDSLSLTPRSIKSLLLLLLLSLWSSSILPPSSFDFCRFVFDRFLSFILPSLVLSFFLPLKIFFYSLSLVGNNNNSNLLIGEDNLTIDPTKSGPPASIIENRSLEKVVSYTLIWEELVDPPSSNTMSTH